nr:hypothetical protein [Tanacetum cinerariifolium]
MMIEISCWMILFGDVPEIEGVEISPFVCKIGKNSRNKRKQLEKYQLIYSDLGPSLSTKKSLTQEEGEKEALAIDICRRYSLLEEERPVIETMAYSDKYKRILHEIFIDKMKLDEAKINLNALANTGFDINVMPYRVYKELGREEVQNVKREITMLNHSTTEPMGLLKDVMYQVGVTTIIVKFLNLDMLIDKNTPILVGRGFLYTCGSILNTIERITSTFNGIFHQTFRATKTSLDPTESDSDNEEEYAIQRNNLGAPIYGPKHAKKEDSDGKWHAEIRLTNPYRNMYDQGCNQFSNSRYKTRLAQFLPRLIYSPCVVDWNVLNPIDHGEAIDELLTIKLCVAVCADDELKTKKIIKFRLCGRAFSWTLLEFAKRLGLYNSEEIEEEGFMCTSKFITKISKRKNLLSEEVLNSLSAPIYCRALDTTTLRELIDFEGRLILEVPEPGDRYTGVFELKAGVYNVPLKGSYNPPGYDQQQYDQYYQQYYQQQQQQPGDDNEYCRDTSLLSD